MATTAGRERDSVSAGVALGLVLCDRLSVRFDKVAVDLAFGEAFRAWDYAGRFPQVGTDLCNGADGVWVLTHACATTNLGVLFWDTSGRDLHIFARHHEWDPNEEEDLDLAVQMIDGAVPREGWVWLARDFLTRLRHCAAHQVRAPLGS